MATYQRTVGGAEKLESPCGYRRSATKHADNVAHCWQKLIAALPPEGFELAKTLWHVGSCRGQLCYVWLLRLSTASGREL